MNIFKELSEKYSKAAKEKDINALVDIFTEDAIYCESDGATYRGLSQIKTWFNQVNTAGYIVEWKSINCIGTGNVGAIEWHFEYQIVDGDLFKTDGVSIVELQNGKFKSWREFTGASNKTYPLE